MRKQSRQRRSRFQEETALLVEYNAFDNGVSIYQKLQPIQQEAIVKILRLNGFSTASKEELKILLDRARVFLGELPTDDEFFNFCVGVLKASNIWIEIHPDYGLFACFLTLPEEKPL